MNRSCTFEGCSEKHYARGYCRLHHYRFIAKKTQDAYRRTPQRQQYMKNYLASYYQENKESLDSKNKRYAQEHPDLIAKIKQKSREKNSHKAHEYYLKRKNDPAYQENRRKAKERFNLMHPNYYKEYHEKNPGKKVEYDYKSMQKLLDAIDAGHKQFQDLHDIWYALSHWANAVKSRDGKLCVVCGQSATVAHHLLYKSLYPKLALNVGNGLSLCDEHHKEIHKFNG